MSAELLDQVTVISITYKSNRLAGRMAATLSYFSHVVLIDNGSADGCATRMRSLLPNATVIERANNDGFGKACNEGVRAAATPFVLLLNPDCHIDSDSVWKLVATLHRYPTAGIAAPQIWREDGTPQMSYRQAFFEPMAPAAYRVPDATCSAKWLHGCCLLLRVDAFVRIGGFDERFFLYYEDDDLCLRMLQAGSECLLEPAANATHVGGASSGSSLKVAFIKSYHYARSRHLAILKYQGRPMALAYVARTLLGAIPAVPAYALLLQKNYAIRWLAWGCAAFVSLWRAPRLVP